uniref:Protein sidekick n=1 Tax=Bactrocera dorsalis TaxID=27457 RepID=A0A034VTL1_BACDO
MEECERRLEKSNPVLFHNNNNYTTYSRCKVPSKLNLCIISGVWLLLSLIGSCYCSDGPQLQAPRFTTQPSSSGSIVSEGRTKILQCHALDDDILVTGKG